MKRWSSKASQSIDRSVDATASVVSLEFGLGQWRPTGHACAACLHTSTRAHGRAANSVDLFRQNNKLLDYVISDDGNEMLLTVAVAC